MIWVQPCKNIIIGGFHVQSPFYNFFLEGERGKRPKLRVSTKYYLNPHCVYKKATEKYLLKQKFTASARKPSWREERHSFCETASVKLSWNCFLLLSHFCITKYKEKLASKSPQDTPRTGISRNESSSNAMQPFNLVFSLHQPTHTQQYRSTQRFKLRDRTGTELLFLQPQWGSIAQIRWAVTNQI